MSLWKTCLGEQYITTLEQKAWRVVEAQHILNARDLVDEPEEYEILEDLLEHAKPPIAADISDPLIFTPFRYPPLEYGSRFGRTHEPSLWYGSLDITTALNEVAYYRLKFNQDSAADLGYIDTLLTAFNVLIKTERGIDLTKQPFSKYTQEISSKTSYLVSQTLGTEMRESGVGAFIFYSARSTQHGKNIAAYKPYVFSKTKHQYAHNHQTWKCVSNKTEVQIARADIYGKTERLILSTAN